MSNYDPHDWYWKHLDGQLYSSARRTEVPADDPVYRCWLAEGNLPTAYPSDEAGAESTAALAEVLAAYGITMDSPAEELIEQHKAEMQTQLTALDAASARPLRAILASQAAGKTADAADLTKLAELEAQAVALRAELAALQRE